MPKVDTFDTEERTTLDEQIVAAELRLSEARADAVRVAIERLDGVGGFVDGFEIANARRRLERALVDVEWEIARSLERLGREIPAGLASRLAATALDDDPRVVAGTVR